MSMPPRYNQVTRVLREYAELLRALHIVGGGFMDRRDKADEAAALADAIDKFKKVRDQ